MLSLSYTYYLKGVCNKMKIKINYPSNQSGVEKLNERIAEFKATLYIESINNLIVSEKTKKQIFKRLIQFLN
jgi:hypothetical protein